MKKEMLGKGLLICVLGLALYNIFVALPRLKQDVTGLHGQVLSLEAKVKTLEEKQLVTSAELQLKTHPEYVDMSLRAWFEKKLKTEPDQVRGIDGKLPRERSN